MTARWHRLARAMPFLHARLRRGAGPVVARCRCWVPAARTGNRWPSGYHHRDLATTVSDKTFVTLALPTNAPLRLRGHAPDGVLGSPAAAATSQWGKNLARVAGVCGRCQGGFGGGEGPAPAAARPAAAAAAAAVVVA